MWKELYIDATDDGVVVGGLSSLHDQQPGGGPPEEEEETEGDAIQWEEAEDRALLLEQSKIN